MSIKEIWNEASLYSKFAIAISFICVPASIINFFIRDERLRLVIWGGITVVMMFNILVTMETSIRQMKRLEAEQKKCLLARHKIRELKNEIKYSNMPRAEVIEQMEEIIKELEP